MNALIDLGQFLQHRIDTVEFEKAAINYTVVVGSFCLFILARFT